MESFFGTLKSECYYLNEYNDLQQAKHDLIEYIEYYPHRVVQDQGRSSAQLGVFCAQQNAR